MKIDNASLQQLFLDARTANGFLDKPVPAALLQEVYDIAKMGATSMNSQPARYVFLTSDAAKQRLMPALSPGNVVKTQSAPVCVIVATDSQFFRAHAAGFPEQPECQSIV
jgi:3-hydroxypropanoate dehydrogenase